MTEKTKTPVIERKWKEPLIFSASQNKQKLKQDLTQKRDRYFDFRKISTTDGMKCRNAVFTREIELKITDVHIKITDNI